MCDSGFRISLGGGFGFEELRSVFLNVSFRPSNYFGLNPNDQLDRLDTPSLNKSINREW